MSCSLAPLQHRFGVRGGVEASVHATQCYVHHLLPSYVVVKLNFKITFNSVIRDKIMKAELVFKPHIYTSSRTLYTLLFLPSPGKIRLFSKWKGGLQQGDSLGPLLVCFSMINLSYQDFSYFTKTMLH